MAVKQVFETYVYDLGLSSVHPTPFVLMQVMGRHGHACGGMPHQKDMQKIQREGMWQCGACCGEPARHNKPARHEGPRVEGVRD
ncbi:hypothetical protein J2X88_005241 [Pseudomonas extremaustralis]|nr:hypothetical protein [Pseudomonas extremaustralis]